MARLRFWLLLLALALSCTACGDGQDAPSLAPDQVVQAYYESLFFHDAENDEDIQKHARFIQDTYFNVTTDHERLTLEVMLPSILSITGSENNYEVDLSGISYEILDQNEATASVRMFGVTRTTSPAGKVHEKDVDSTYQLERFDGVWKISKLN